MSTLILIESQFFEIKTVLILSEFLYVQFLLSFQYIFFISSTDNRY